MKKWLLPIIAIVALVTVVMIIYVVPAINKNSNNPYAARNKEGDVVIKAADLSHDEVSFIRIAENSKIELMARLGDDGAVKLAFGTCQSCNGSPHAYYTQEGDQLICNNCGLTFPLSVLDEPGGGCHPIIVPDAVIKKSSKNLVLDTNELLRYEALFEKVAEH